MTAGPIPAEVLSEMDAMARLADELESAGLRIAFSRAGPAGRIAATAVDAQDRPVAELRLAAAVSLGEPLGR